MQDRERWLDPQSAVESRCTRGQRQELFLSRAGRRSGERTHEMTMEELRAEYSAVRIGPLILHEVRTNLSRLVRMGGYDPEVYAGSKSWDDAEEDVLQAIVVQILLEEGQLDYIMATSSTLIDFHNLLARQVRRYLARTRQRSVVDNLLDRSVNILSDEPFETAGSGSHRRYRLRSAPPTLEVPTDADLLGAARSAAMIPRIPFAVRERAPMVYSNDALRAVLRTIAETLATSFSHHDLDWILRALLTDWITGFLIQSEGLQVAASELTPEDQLVVREAAQQIVQESTHTQLIVLRGKLESRSDQSIADELSLSRPTVIERKREALRIVEIALMDLPERVHRAVIDQLSIDLATHSESDG